MTFSFFSNKRLRFFYFLLLCFQCDVILSSDLPIIPPSEIQINESEKLGGGSYGDVYKGQWIGSPIGPVAIKRFKIDIPEGEISKEIENEARIMRQLSTTPYVVSLHGISWAGRRCSLVMEIMPKGSLFDVLHNGQDLPWDIRYSIAIDVAKGIELLHNRDIIHRDLKSHNILLSSHMRAKISDFGLSKVKSYTSTSTGIAPSGTLQWMAPELLGLRPKHSKSSDIYAYAMICWEIASRKIPYEGVDNHVLIGEIKSGEREELPENSPPIFNGIIESGWDKDPLKRGSITDIINKLTSEVAWRPGPKPILKVWEYNQGHNVALSSNSVYKLIEVDLKEKFVQKIVEAYNRCPVQGMTIKKVSVIYNPRFDEGFSSRLETLEGRHGNKVFEPKWKTEEKNLDLLSLRTECHGLLESMPKDKDLDAPHVNIMMMWHGTTKTVLESLCRTGYANLAQTDSGFFGKGIYNSYEAEYAYRVYGPGLHKDRGVLLINWISWYSAYPVIDGDMQKLTGGSNVGNHDAHFIPVKPKTENSHEVNYIPCAKGDRAKYHEFVVFESSQCLPRYVVELEESISSNQSSSPSIIASLVDPVSTANLGEPITNPVTSFSPVALNPNSVQPSTLEETTLPVPPKKPQPVAKVEKSIIPVERPLPDGIEQKYRGIYETFLRAQLIYKPNKENNEGMITFKFSDLPNPLEGEFDLSRCGDAGRYLSINTGYRTMERSQHHSNKVEYWITPTFMIERDLSYGTRHMTPVWKNIKDTAITYQHDWHSWSMDEYWYIGKPSNGSFNLYDDITQNAHRSPSKIPHHIAQRIRFSTHHMPDARQLLLQF